jgi:hypothetical protein
MQFLRNFGITVFALAVAAHAAMAEEPRSENKLVGTWRQVSAKFGGKDFKPAGATTLKLVTPEQFMWMTYDKDGRVTRAAGGDYTLTGDAYVEQPAYGMSSDFQIIKGAPQKFTCKLEGNKWHHNGALSNGLTIEEIWEREEPRHDDSGKSELIGTWRVVSDKLDGKEIEFAKGTSHFIHVTPSHCAGVSFDKDGKMTDGGASACVLKNNTFVEYPISGLVGETRYLRNQHTAQTFRIDGKKCYITGMHSDGYKIEALYERVTKK